MIDKSSASLTEALSQIKDGATIMIGGFGTAGQPAELIDGLIELGALDPEHIITPGIFVQHVVAVKPAQ